LPAQVEVDVEVPVVAPELAADALDALRRLGLLEVSAATVLDALLDRMERDQHASREQLWAQAWDLAAKVTTSDLQAVLIDRHGLSADDVYVRSMGGRFVPLATTVLPGDLLRIEDFDASHRDLLVDVDRHRRELELLRRLGAADRPRADGGSFDEPWLKRHLDDAIAEAVADAQRHGARAKAGDFEIVHAERWAGPAETLGGLLPDAAARFARELLTVNPDFEPWEVRAIKGQRVAAQLEHPVLWRVRTFGRLPSTKGVRPIGECVTTQLRELDTVLPVVDLPRAACRALGLPDTVSELDEHRVQVALAEAEGLTRPEELGAVYATLTAVHPRPPDRIRAVVRDVPMWVEPTDACVAVSEKDARVLRLTGNPYIRVDDEDRAEHLAAVWRLKSVGEVVSSRLSVIADGEPEPAADAFPLLRLILGPVVEGVDFLACRELQREMYTERGSVSEPLDFELRDGVAHHLSDMDDATRVRRLADRLGHPLALEDVKAILENAQAAELQALLARARAAPDDAQRLALLLDTDVLRARIPTELIDAVEETDGELDHLQTAELSLNVFGVETLKVYREALTQLGLAPPGQWTGRRPAVKFVTEELGFPRTYAGFAETRLEQTLEVPGPAPLPRLHDFQRRAANAILELVHEQRNPRGMLKLPTGAGKTRVTVQALIEWMTSSDLRAPVLWIAQTEELCEQAVQSWAEVWRAVGPKNRSLLISRLWGGHSAEPREDQGDQVVVATIDKIMARCLTNSDYDWLRDAAGLVIDEAHGATTPSYTDLLRWTGIQDATEHAPLIGLSATPYRGSERETERLAGRFGVRRLDEGVFDEEVSIDLLVRERILARVDHRILEGSQDVPLTSAEREHIRTLRELPASVLNKIGGDLDRTNRLIESVMSLEGDWPVLIFAASVAHAGTVAALLARRGRSAAAVSASTPTSVRRHLISEFRKGRLATLTNYGVLTQGFDAPSIRALYIARPTYSANLYQQMIGRGLRGPANNGKEVCTVFDVADNVTAYGLDLAFREFEHVWKRWQPNSD
jgi:superfamily II DNA or RNA helicase